MHVSDSKLVRVGNDSHIRIWINAAANMMTGRDEKHIEEYLIWSESYSVGTKLSLTEIFRPIGPCEGG